ncbi:hypothetical protein [Amycolatopsis sp. NPDC003731]
MNDYYLIARRVRKAELRAMRYDKDLRDKILADFVEQINNTIKSLTKGND